MAKSMVEKYEQILAQDPASTAFVELAKALIEQGDHAKAIDVCQGGLSHHANSVVGRVLWGKALINLGRPAEAMEQFDQAVAINKDNAHAYNLIGEVLLHKGLYRSALPLLKKAVTLQPNDGRVRQWLEQTQRALSGGPAPVLSDPTEITAEPPAPTPATSPTVPAMPAVSVPLGAVDPDKTDVGFDPAPAGSAAQDPFSQVPARSSSSDTIRGITSTFDALASEPTTDAGVVIPTAETAEAPRRSAPAKAAGAGSEPTIIPSADLMQEFAAGPTDPGGPEAGGLLGDLPPVPKTGEAETFESAANAVPARGSAAAAGLLEDIPDLSGPIEVPKVAVSGKTTQAIAQEYERELRAKLAAQAQNKNFLQRHGAKLAVFAVCLVAAAVALGAWRLTLAKHHGLNLKDALARAKVGVTQDTGPSYRSALDALHEAEQMDDSVTEVFALAGYARALLFAEHGGRAEDRAAAQAAFARPGVAEQFPGLGVAVSFYLADANAKPAALKAVMDSGADQPEVNELAGRLLIVHKDKEKDVKAALERLRRATQEAPSDVRALVALGDYYRESGDFPNAVDMYGRGLKVSPQHPQAAVGNAEAVLDLQLDTADTLKQLESLKPEDDWPPGLPARRDLVFGRLLSAAGRHDDAITLLAQGAKQHRAAAFQFEVALGDAQRAAGHMAEAQRAFETALGLSKRDEAKEGLGRVLIARDREKELLARIPQEVESRHVSLVRGIAYARQGDWKHARQELTHTQQGGKYPSEAVIYLALADAAEGQQDRAQQVLEKTLAASKKARGEVHVALGKVYWDRGVLDKARAQFEEAAKDPADYEGGCALGRLLLQLGLPDVAVKPLQTSVEHNPSHGESRQALARADELLGKADEALQVAQGGVDDNASSAAAERELANALLAVGKVKEADAAINRSLRLDSSDSAAYRVQAKTLFAQGDPKAGMKALERADKLHPKDAETFCEFGKAFLRQGNGETAGKAFQAAKVVAQDSACGAAGMRMAALPYGTKQAEKELTELVNNTSTSVPDKAFAHAALARTLLAMGKAKDARKAAEQAVALGPHSADAFLALGLVAVKQRDDAKAREALVQAVTLDPSYALAQLTLGDVLVKGGEADAPSAVAAYEWYLHVVGSSGEQNRVQRALINLKKKVASR
jgi:tetratricopeptide (TPR) repeat protein